MFVRWQGRKLQKPAIGPFVGEVRDATGEPVRNKRGSLLRTRQREDGTMGQDVRWFAVLIQAVRVNGKPRQRHIATIASIAESGIEVDHQRRYFWDDVCERLDQLGNRLTVEDRRRVEATIAIKVPRLSREEHDASIAECVSGIARLGCTPIEHKPYREPA